MEKLIGHWGTEANVSHSRRCLNFDGHIRSAHAILSSGVRQGGELPLPGQGYVLEPPLFTTCMIPLDGIMSRLECPKSVTSLMPAVTHNRGFDGNHSTTCNWLVPTPLLFQPAEILYTKKAFSCRLEGLISWCRISLTDRTYLSVDGHRSAHGYTILWCTSGVCVAATLFHEMYDSIGWHYERA